MTGLRELFEDLASGPAPPSPAVPGRLFAEGRRRRRQRRAALGGGLALAATVLVALAGMAGMVNRAPGQAPAAPTGPVPGRTVPSAAIWAGATDANHLYVAVQGCADLTCQKGTARIMASADAGRTWSYPGDPINLARLVVIGPGTLLASAVGSMTPVVSVDSGRTWTPLRLPAGPVASGRPLVCQEVAQTAGCRIAAVDAAARTVRLLAAQPPVLPTDQGDLVTVAGTTYVSGLDPQRRRPAVAWTRDGGRTWASHTFTDTASCTSSALCPRPRVTSVDGVSAYAEFNQVWTTRRLLYHTDGSGWLPVSAANLPAYEVGGTPPAFITRDGTYVVGEFVRGATGVRDTVSYWALRGDGFEPAELRGLPSAAWGVGRTPDGWYYTISFPTQALYGSTDGWSWTPVIA